MGRKKQNNEGFSLIELVTVICIMVALVVTLALVVTKYISKAGEAKSGYNARVFFDAAQVAVISASVNTDTSFKYAIKYEENIDGEPVRMGRFSSQSLYKYLQEGSGAGSLSGAKSKATDYYIAEQLVASLPNVGGEIEGDLLKNKSPITDGHSVKYMSEHPEIYGRVIFAMAYSGSGEIIYFQCVYDDYFYEFDGEEFSGKKVDDATYFNNWPNTRFTESATDKW